MSASVPWARCVQRSGQTLARCSLKRTSVVAATCRAPSRARPSTLRSLTYLPMRRAQNARLFSTNARRLMPDEEDAFDPASIERESDEVDVCIVGGGPAGLSAAIRLKQLANEAGNEDFRVLVLEKAGDIGAHILSGAVIQPSSINELIPDWLDESNPDRFEYATPAGTDRMRFLTKTSSIPIPAPPQMSNHGNYIVSLNQFVKWLGERAEEVGVEVYPGFAAAEVLYNADGSVKGVATNDLGMGRDGQPKDTFERGMEFHARVTMFGEGCHGSLTKQVINKFDLRKDSQHQTYGLGLKEVWEVDPAKFEKGLIVHSMGYPLPKEVYGEPVVVPIPRVPEAQAPPLFKNVLEGGCLPGGALIGDSAGFINVPKVKGTHNAMKSGMLAAEAAWNALSSSDEGTVFLYEYEESLRKSPIWKELKEVRNMRPSFHSPLGMYGGIVYSGLEAYILKGRTPWTLKHKTPDYASTKPADKFPKIEYEKPDGKISFDILTSVSRTGTNHEEDQPVHLQVKDWDEHTDKTYPPFKGLENRFCPAGVYEYVEDESKPHGVRFQINSQNCIHCKTCDIKAPHQDINWQVPQGGEGPKYYMT
uniref:Electron transfer flavoprotein-ubiquinone oxidoreductase n=1 Tax=Bionectria ochroleuca TaxID=29856 RepID=A0A8H7TS22_BIOOC